MTEKEVNSRTESKSDLPFSIFGLFPIKELPCLKQAASDTDGISLGKPQPQGKKFSYDIVYYEGHLKTAHIKDIVPKLTFRVEIFADNQERLSDFWLAFATLTNRASTKIIPGPQPFGDTDTGTSIPRVIFKGRAKT